MTETERALRDCKDMLDDIYKAVQERQLVLNLFDDDTMMTKFEKQMIIFMHKWDALKAEYGL